VNNIPKTGKICDDVLPMKDLMDMPTDAEGNALYYDEWDGCQNAIDADVYDCHHDEGHVLSNVMCHNGWEGKMADVKLGKRMGEIFGELESGYEERDENMPEDEWMALQQAPMPTKKVFQDFGIGKNYAFSDAWAGFTYTR
jgi:hypothetical protein